jgi:integrase
MLYSTKSDRDCLILELQALCGLRIGEVLKLMVFDVADRKLTILEPKSGKEGEIAFMPEQITKRLTEYIAVHDLAQSCDAGGFPVGQLMPTVRRLRILRPFCPDD